MDGPRQGKGLQEDTDWLSLATKKRNTDSAQNGFWRNRQEFAGPQKWKGIQGKRKNMFGEWWEVGVHGGEGWAMRSEG